MVLVLVGIGLFLHVWRLAHARKAAGCRAAFGRGRIMVHGIQPEAVDTAIQPEAHRIEQRVLHRRVVEIEVRLRGEELVHKILLAHPVPLPGWAPEDRQPVIGRACRRVSDRPRHTSRPSVVVAACAALDEPGVLVRGMRQHLVDDDPQPKPVRLGEHRVEIGKRAEQSGRHRNSPTRHSPCRPWAT